MPTFFFFKRLQSLGAVISMLFLSGIIIGLSMWLAPSSKAAGTTYHVASNGNDSNSCSAAQSTSSAKRSIQAGVNCATQPGDIVSVHAGTYTESVSISSSGVSGNPIRIQPANYTNDGCGTPGCGSGDNVTWQGGATSAAVSITDHSHIRVQRFTFSNTATSQSTGFPNGVIYANRSACYASADNGCKSSPVEGLEFLNNTFSNNGNDGSSSGNQSNVFVWHYIGRVNTYSGPSTSLIAGNTFTGNYGNALQFGGTSDVRVANNNLTSGFGSVNTSLVPPDWWYEGTFMNVYGVCGSNSCTTPDNLLIEGNTIANITSGNYPQEMVGLRFDACKGPHGTVIQDNVIHDIHDAANSFGSFNDNQSYGMFFEASCPFTVMQRNLIYNVRMAGMVFGRSDGPTANGQVLHNTVYVNAVRAIHLFAGDAGTFKNNIFVNTGTDSSSAVVGTESLVTTGNLWRNNLHWNPNTTLVGTWHTNIFSGANLTLAQWNSSSGETGSKNANPLFVNPSAGDFHLQSNSPAKNAGDDGLDLGAYPQGGGGTPTPTPTPTPTCSPVPGSLYLSDLCPTYESNGWGPMEKDKSVGDAALNDGTTITLNGVTYQKGLGTHAPADIRYALGGQYAAFQSSVGIDDEIDSDTTCNSSAVFQVYLDNVKVFDSGIMGKTSPTQQVNVDVSGKQELKLIVTDAGDGYCNDHTDWADAKLTKTGTPTACHLYTPSSSIPSGFGSPYDVVTSPSTNLMNVTCDTASARIDLGKADPLQYIYNQGYLFKTGGTNWTQIPYTSSESLIANAWYPKSATTNISLTSTELANPSYNLAYICSWTGTAWKCGCRDSACTQSYWQIQSFKR